MGGWNGGGGWSAGSWLGMGLGMLIFWGLVITAVIALWHWVGQGRQQAAGSEQRPLSPGSPTALRMLDERYAGGDLTEEDYRRRRDVLLGQ
jgi:putative membrane protein